jgi:hypothetical protein
VTGGNAHPELKTLCLPYYAYVFSSTKSEIRAEQDLPVRDWGKRGRR